MKCHIPNMLTAANLICGCAAIPLAASGDIRSALLLVVVGAVFDFFDGFAARQLGVSSPVGKELDSLADVVTFGAVPSAMVVWQLSELMGDSASPLLRYLPYLGYLIAAFSALRLAKFNLDERQHHGFIGLPTPANALFWAAVVLSLSQRSDLLGDARIGSFVLLVLVMLSCWCMVSEVPMLAFKMRQGDRRGNGLRIAFLLAILLLSVGAWCLGFGALGIAAGVVVYVLVSIAVARSPKV